MNDATHLDALAKYRALEAAASMARHYHERKLVKADEMFGKARIAYFDLLSACESYPNRRDMVDIGDKAAKLFVQLLLDTGRQVEK